MKASITLTLLFAFLFKGWAQSHTADSFIPYQIDSKVKTTLLKAMAKAEEKISDFDEGYWFFMNQEMFAEFSEGADPKNFLDTMQEYIDGVCDCMIKKDTVYLQGGIAYEGGVGFDIRIVKNLFSAKIWIAGKGYRTDTTAAYGEEISLNSKWQRLKLYRQYDLRRNEKIIGEILIESENFYELNKAHPDKIYMKLLFHCKLDDQIVF